MAFPIETEARIKRRILETCQDHIRKSLETVREVPRILESYSKRDFDEVQNHYHNLRRLEEETLLIKRNIMRELSEIGSLLASREDFLRLTFLVTSIADNAEGVGFRVRDLSDTKLRVKKDILEDIMRLSEATVETCTRLRETIMTLNYGSAKVLELARDVDTAEKNCDELHRKTQLKILLSNMKLPLILFTRDLCERMESISDLALDAADVVRTLAISN
ncbi:MAG TPA: DUF47 family protein [Candidatus Bathyarchaeia archaeon]|nr:DUF47 family protein [Candidatus Bathyarchaeia archaeon]